MNNCVRIYNEMTGDTFYIEAEVIGAIDIEKKFKQVREELDDMREFVDWCDRNGLKIRENCDECWLVNTRNGQFEHGTVIVDSEDGYMFIADTIYSISDRF